MGTIRNLSAIAALLAIAALSTVAALELHAFGADVRGRASRVEASLHRTFGAVDQLRADLAGLEAGILRESERWRIASDAQATAYRGALERQVDAIRSELTPVAQQAVETLAAYGEIPQDIQPAFHNLELLTRHSDEAVRMWTPQVNGLVAGWKVVGGETALTMREWRRASPALINGVNQIVTNSNRTTEATARVMGNFAEATKPLPRWIRIGLGIAPPLAQTAAGAATTLALTGR